MTVGAPTIHHQSSRKGRVVGRVRISPIVASALRLPKSAHGHFQHAGQFGPVRETELGRRLGARI